MVAVKNIRSIWGVKSELAVVDRSRIQILLISLSIFVFGFFLVRPPEFYVFGTSSNGVISEILESPIHLDDDVMISLRTGVILNEIGIPAFNRSDIAQPSTSYLAPYLAGILHKFFPGNLATLFFTLIGFIAVLVSLVFIVHHSKSKMIGVTLVIFLMSTSTFHQFAFQGWDHNLQSFFLILSLHLLFSKKTKFRYSLALGIVLFFAVAYRPDAAIIAISILLAHWIKFRNISHTLLVTFIFLSLVFTSLVLNYRAFGYLTPTTFRLKTGSPQTLVYIMNYLKENFFHFSALTVFIIGFIIFLLKRKHIPLFAVPIVVGTVVTATYCAFVSDVFTGGRMFWSSAIVVCAILGYGLEANQFFGSRFNFRPKLWVWTVKEKTPGFTVNLILMVWLLFQVQESYMWSSDRFLIKDSELSATSAQFDVAMFINHKMDPRDGSVGLYWLGVGYHLPQFEIADFLGKADELIANESSQWGPPGHNKWDTNASVMKWNPQIIIPSQRDMFEITVSEAISWQSQRQDWGFVADLRTSPVINSRYTYCYIITKENVRISPWEFYLRNDLLSKYDNYVRCN